MLSLEGCTRVTCPDRVSSTAWLDAYPALIDEAASLPGIEDAMSILTGAARRYLGDRSAAGRNGALKTGERDYRVSGVFLIAPDRRHNVLVANHGFPTEQRRLSIPIGWNHPGQVVTTERMMLLENTDEHSEFRQFLKTSRMGSSLYMPIFTGSGMVGQIVVAAQARGTYSSDDIAPMSSLAAGVALLWEARDGPAWWANDHPAEDAWYAEENRI